MQYWDPSHFSFLTYKVSIAFRGMIFGSLYDSLSSLCLYSALLCVLYGFVIRLASWSYYSNVFYIKALSADLFAFTTAIVWKLLVLYWYNSQILLGRGQKLGVAIWFPYQTTSFIISFEASFLAIAHYCQHCVQFHWRASKYNIREVCILNHFKVYSTLIGWKELSLQVPDVAQC